jgi:hypothetical protein
VTLSYNMDVDHQLFIIYFVYWSWVDDQHPCCGGGSHVFSINLKTFFLQNLQNIIMLALDKIPVYSWFGSGSFGLFSLDSFQVYSSFSFDSFQVIQDSI